MAAGLVFGIGSSATLAAWNDEEYAQGTIRAASFTLQSNGGNGFAASTAENPRTLTFSAPATAMFPGESTFALLQVRTAESSIAGTVRFLGAPQASGFSSEYTYGVRTVSGAQCNANAFADGASVVEPGSALGTGAQSSQPVSGAGGNTVNYCLRLTMRTSASNAVQNQSINPVWVVQGTSESR